MTPSLMVGRCEWQEILPRFPCGTCVQMLKAEKEVGDEVGA